MRCACRLCVPVLIAGLLHAAAAWAQTAAPPSTTTPATPASTSENVTGATANLAPGDPPGEWRSAPRDYANTRYSPLNKIDTSNVHQLRIAWSFADGVLFGHEDAPLVVGDTMYVVTPYPNNAYALDLSKPGVPVKWVFQPHPSLVAVGKACCDAVNRGAAFANGKLIYNLLDDHTVAVDAKTGKQVWRTKMDNVEDGVTMTMAPFVVGNHVLVGNSGGEMGVHGWLAALDVDTGQEQWRAYSRGPDTLVKIGPDFKPFYAWMRGKDLGVTTWPAGMWQHGGGASWAWISYDPQLNLIYYGTSNPSPRVPAQRPGYNLWTSAMFARNPDTGMAKWAYQFTPHDQWDYDGVNEDLLIDIPLGGKTRKALIHFDRNGFAYTIDRTDGQVLIAQKYGSENWSSGVDLKTGMPVVVADKQPKVDVKVDNLCPTDLGSKDWEPSAFSPRTGLVYAGILNVCMDLTDHPVSYIAGTPYDGMEMLRHPGAQPAGKWGEFMAWDPVKGRKVWSIPEPFMILSGVLATAGDVVFYGTVDGWFRALDARSGKVLWSQKLSSGIIGQPITYLGPHGRQYVAIYAGVGGAAGVEKAQNGFPARGSTLYVFSVNGDSPNSGPGMLTTQGATAGAAYEQAPF